MAGICVRYSSPEFKAAKRDYGASDLETSAAINGYLNNYNTHEIGSDAYNDFIDNYADHPEYKQYLDHWFLRGTNDLIQDSAEHAEKHAHWVKALLETSKPYTKQEALNLLHGTETTATQEGRPGLETMFGKENVKIFMDDNGNHLIKIAEPKLASEHPTPFRPQVRELSKFEEAKEIAETIIEESERRTKFYEESHEYEIDGKKADISVTRMDHADINMDEAWRLPSLTIGNTNDAMIRDAFSDEGLKDSYPNMTATDIEYFKQGVQKMKDHFDKLYPDGYKVYSNGVRVFSEVTLKGLDGKDKTYVASGTLDLLVVSADGKMHVYDAKSSRSGNIGRNMHNHSRLMRRYSNIAQALNPAAQGRFEDHVVLGTNVNYPDPTEPLIPGTEKKGDYARRWIYRADDSGQLYLTDMAENNPTERMILDYGRDPNDPNSIGAYSAPYITMDNAIIDDANFRSELKETYKRLDPAASDFSGEPGVDNSKTTVKDGTTEILRKLRELIHDSNVIGIQDRVFLIDNVMNYTSFIISQLETDIMAPFSYLPDGKYDSYDFTTMSRAEILEIIDINDVFDSVREMFYNPANRMDENLSLEAYDNLLIIYDNWNAVIEAGNRKLHRLEDITINRVTDIQLEHGDYGVNDMFEMSTIEEAIKEHWHQGYRHISARSGLALQVRRIFERLENVDSNGNRIYHKKYNMLTFIDGGTAVNQVFQWTRGATSLELMIEKLLKKTKTAPWVNQVIDKIKTEPFRSAFFKNFRKDHLIYGVVNASFDENGNRVYKNVTINTMGAVDTIMGVILGRFQDGMMEKLLIPNKNNLEGEGVVNVESINAMKERHNKLYDRLNGLTGESFHKALSENIMSIKDMLSDLGFTIELDTLEALLNENSEALNLRGTSLNTIFTLAEYILNTMLKNADNPLYTPLKYKSKGNVHGTYNKIADALGKHVESHIEASSFENGKMYYSFVTPSYMGKLMSRLSNELQGSTSEYQQYLHDEFGKFRWFKEGGKDGSWNTPWLRMLEDSNANREGLLHKVQLHYDKIDYKDLSELGYTVSLMSEFFYDGDHKNWAWFRLPIMSDKPSSEFVRFRRLRGLSGKQQITEGMQNVFHQEILRMKTVLEMAVNKEIGELYPERANNVESVKNLDAHGALSKPENDGLRTKLLKGEEITHSDLVRDGKLVLQGTGAEFKFLYMFNENIINNDEIGQLIIQDLNGTLTNKHELSDAFKELFPIYMNEQFQVEKAKWEELGLYEMTSKKSSDPLAMGAKIIGLKYLLPFADLMLAREYTEKVSNEQKLIDKANDALEEYMWNDYFATVNLIQLTVTDLAYSENMEDFQKRYSQTHSPSNRLNLTATFDLNGKQVRYSDGISRTMYISDEYIRSQMVQSLKLIFDDKVESGEMTNGQSANILSKYGYHTDIIDGVRYVKYIENGREILVPTQDIEVTDGQAYSSLTSYRKKLGMAGEWGPGMSAAYEIIKSGKWVGEDLNVIWQPLKGFVFTHVSKATGLDSNGTMSELKIPTQHKNSEYLLLMADAIIRDEANKTGKKNKLNAIYDFMEESAENSDGSYSQMGIDTIQHASAVKQGLTGVVNLNLATTYLEVLDILRHAAYGSTEASARNADNYNNGMVHSFPFEDYGIQQNVPAGLVDSDVMLGSQMRVLTMNDFSPNAVFNIGSETLSTRELQSLYQGLIADNINDSYDLLMKELAISDNIDNRKERNEKLSELLIKEVKKDLRYSTDLIRALETVDGEFVIPLSESMHSTRIQLLLNSIIKTRIVKLRTNGGSRVQVSVSGLSRNLNVIYKDSKGKELLTRSQFTGTDTLYAKYIKENQHSVSHLETLISIPTQEMTDALTKEDGSLMTVLEALSKGIINEEMLKGIAYRIPTEDKYSIFPTKAVGFVPKAAGEVIILPAEITTISGADFDIDKMYVTVKSFKYQEYKGEDALSKQVAREYNKLVEDGTINPDELSPTQFYTLNQSKFRKKGFFENKNTTTRDGRNNRIFDLLWAALTSSETMDKMFDPGGFDPLKKTSRITLLLKTTNIPLEELSTYSLQELDALMTDTNSNNILFSTNQVYFHKLNMTAAKTIGIFANHNTSHAFLSMQDISLNIIPGKEINFDGRTISRGLNSKIDSIYSLDGTSRISKVIAGYLAASVDGAKDPVLNAMNVNTFTSNVAMLLTRLGFDELSVGLFLTQPSIEKITREYFRLNNEGYVSGEVVIKNELMKLAEEGYKGTPLDLASNMFTKELMAKNIRDLANGISDNLTKSFDVLTLMLMQRLLDHAKSLGDLTKLTRYNSATIQPSMISEALVLEMQYDKFMNEDMANENTAPFSISARDVFRNSPILNAFYENTIGPEGALRQIFKSHFPHYGREVLTALSFLSESISSELDAKTIELMVNFYTLYKLTLSNQDYVNGHNSVFDGSRKSRDYYLNAFPKIFEETIQGKIKGNFFLDSLSIAPANDRMPVRTINAKVGNFSMEAQERFSNGWTELITSNDPQLRRLGLDLVYYNIHRSGLSFNPQTFLHLLSVEGKLAIPGYVDALRDTNYGYMLNLASNMLHSFKRNYAHQYKLAPHYRENENVKKTYNKLRNVWEFNYGKEPKFMGSLLAKSTGSNNSPRFVDYMWMEGSLWALDGDPIGTVVSYKKTSRLGMAHNAIEVDANESSLLRGENDTMKSVLADTQYEDLQDALMEHHGEHYDFSGELYQENDVDYSEEYMEDIFTEGIYNRLLDYKILTPEQVDALRNTEEKRLKLHELLKDMVLNNELSKMIDQIIKEIC